MFLVLSKRQLLSLAITSFCLFVFSLILIFFIVPGIISDQIDKNIRLERGTEQWHRFRQTPFNISFNITIFEVTNGEDVLKGTAPNVIEKGPYVFDEIIKKFNFVYNENNETISYQRTMNFYFNQSKSGPSLHEDDTVTIINPAYMAAIQLFKDNAPPVVPIGMSASCLSKCLKKMFPDGLLLRNVPVTDLIFNGVKLCDFKDRACQVLMINVCDPFVNKSKTVDLVDDGHEKYLKFSFFNYKMKSPDGVYEVKSGMDNAIDVGLITNWNYNKYSNIWSPEKPNNTCNYVTGTDGTIFQPHVTRVSNLSVFSTDNYRSTPLFYNGTASHQDIEGYLFKPSADMFYARDSCFCMNKTLDSDGTETCFMDGVMDIFPCTGAPVLLSFPHFLYADKRYRENLTGDISPDPDKHEMYMLIDKYTGIPLQGHKRAQMSIVLRPVDHFPESKTIARTVLPVFWMDEGLDLPEEGANMLYSLLYNSLTIVKILEWLFSGSTLCVTILTIIVYLRKG